MAHYAFFDAAGATVIETGSRRLIYLNAEPTRHTQDYIKWRDGWIETIPAWTETIPATETEPERVIEHPAQTVTHPPHVTAPYVAPPPLPVEKVREQKWQQIKAERDRRKESGVKVGEHWFHTDTFSRTQHLGLVLMGANMPVGAQWKTMNGTYVTMTPALAQQIFSAIAAADMTTHAVAEQKRSAMMSLEDPSNYDAYAGWPEVYA